MKRIIVAIRIALSAVTFAAFGAAGRFVFQNVETRWQIAVFCAVALLLEASASDRGRVANWNRFIVHAVAATAAIIAAKWHLEGISPILLNFSKASFS